MANPNPRIKNLIPIKKGQLSKEELKKRQHNGGVKSVEVRKEKKLLSSIYAKALENELNIANSGRTLSQVVESELAAGNVQMFKEVREATEGSKVSITTNSLAALVAECDKISPDELKRSLK